MWLGARAGLFPDRRAQGIDLLREYRSALMTARLMI